MKPTPQAIIATQALRTNIPIIGQMVSPAEAVRMAEIIDREMGGWRPIDEAPKDREIIVYCPPAHGLPHMASVCAWHEDAGFCVCELREPTMYMPTPQTP